MSHQLFAIWSDNFDTVDILKIISLFRGKMENLLDVHLVLPLSGII
jgi:hypothetical protein